MRRQIPVVLFALACASPLSAAEMPTRKAGLWELKMNFEGRNIPVQSMQHCTDASTDKQMTTMNGLGRSTCSKQDVQTSAGRVTVDSVCNVGGVNTTSHAEVSGDFNSAYTVKVTSKTEGGSPAMQQRNPGGETHMTIEAKWVGPCKAGQRPGDIMMGNGMTMNIRDMQNMQQNLQNMPGGMRPQR